MQDPPPVPLTPGEEQTLRRIGGGVSMTNFLSAADIERLKTLGLIEQSGRRVFITEPGKSRLAAAT